MTFSVSAEMKTWFAARGVTPPDTIEIADGSIDLLERHKSQAARHKGWTDEQRSDWALWVTYTHVEHGAPPVEPLSKPQAATLVDQIQSDRINAIEQHSLPATADPDPDPEDYELEWLPPTKPIDWILIVGWSAVAALMGLQTFFIHGIWAHFGR